MLNVAEDHLDWHGSMDAYARDKARALDGRVAVVGLDDPVAAGCSKPPRRRCGSASGSATPPSGSWGCATALLIDNAFADGLALADVGVDPGGRAGRGAQRARRRGAGPRRRRARRRPSPDALTGFHVGPHRAEVVAASTA